MPSWPLRIWRAPLCLSAALFLATPACGAEPESSSVPPHPLVIAAEALYQRNLPQACDELMKQAAMAPGLTDDDLIRLQFLTALRALDDGDELGARRAISRAFRIDPAAAVPSFASKLGKLVEQTRMPPSGAPSDDRSARLAAARKAAGEREPASAVLLKAMDQLYTDLQIDGAGVVLDLARASAAPARAQVAVRQGILRMEVADEAGARAAFKEALEADRSTSLPLYAPPKTIQVFEEVKRALTAAAAEASAPRPAKPPVPEVGQGRGTTQPLLAGSRGWGVAVGGAGLALVAGGAVAGVVALSSYQAEQRASTSGDYSAYTQNRDASYTAINVADGLYTAGALALGVGAYLFLSAPGDVSVGASAGPGRASVVVGGHF